MFPGPSTVQGQLLTENNHKVQYSCPLSAECSSDIRPGAYRLHITDLEGGNGWPTSRMVKHFCETSCQDKTTDPREELTLKTKNAKVPGNILVSMMAWGWDFPLTGIVYQKQDPAYPRDWKSRIHTAPDIW